MVMKNYALKAMCWVGVVVLAGCVLPDDVNDEISSYTGSARLSWIGPVSRVDGSDLLDLAGFKVYYGPTEQSLSNVIDIDVGTQTTLDVESLPPCTHYFAVTAYDSDGIESAYSNVVTKDISP